MQEICRSIITQEEMNIYNRRSETIIVHQMKIVIHSQTPLSIIEWSVSAVQG